MRIIAGKWRRRLIEAPVGRATRPTADRVRETLFSIVGSRLGSFQDLRVADLFAGSGALGFEALSRGAACVTFVESDPAAGAVIRRNAQRFGVAVQIFSGSALELEPSQSFDLIFADPPYDKRSGSAVVRSVLESNWLVSGGWLSVETSRDEMVDAQGLEIESVRELGSARLTLLRRP